MPAPESFGPGVVEIISGVELCDNYHTLPLWCGAALVRCACRDGLSASGLVERFRSRAGGGFAIRGALRPYVEFISDAWHGEGESGRPRVRLYLAPQAGDEHIDAAVIGFRATPRNGGKSMWLSTEIEAWIAALPVRRLKGDEPLEMA